MFCEECISTRLMTNSTCPTCEISLAVGELSRALYVEKLLESLSVWCCYHFVVQKIDDDETWIVDSEGCNFSSQLKDMKSHQEQCEYAWVSCQYSKNCGKTRRKNIELHSSSCQYRPVCCDFCGIPVPAEKMSEHHSTCWAIPISCQLCEEVLCRGDLREHTDNHCLESFFSCPYGCEQKFRRKNIPQHMSEKVVVHLDETRKNFEKLFEETRNSYKVELKKIEKEVNLLKQKVKDEVKLVWIVKDWSRVLRTENYTQSKFFQLGDETWWVTLFIHFHHWSWSSSFPPSQSKPPTPSHCHHNLLFPVKPWFVCLKSVEKNWVTATTTITTTTTITIRYFGMYTNGDTPESRGYISLYLILKSEVKGRSFLAEWKVSIINHKDHSHNFHKTFFSNFPLCDGQGWGERKFSEGLSNS
eukprot:TRINITY_DN1657_c0_g1_i18.p1 TRINITY_DN1657_c0_g1~~TRINITY_DN1657_c0_g1_i18.p1  ORF type:complete len:415 (+),score=73.79 TRINITY_DN1657_c0_g1_i18:176-1420(+)